MQNIGRFLLGFLLGVLLPLAFIWVYLYNFYPADTTVWEMVKALYPGPLFGKLLLLSILPDLILAFVFYKFDSFKFGGGVLLGAVPFLITAVFMFG